jgi:hypothetical protein
MLPRHLLWLSLSGLDSRLLPGARHRLDLLFLLLGVVPLQPLPPLARLAELELVEILIMSAEMEVMGISVPLSAPAAALLAFLGMAETAEASVQQRGGAAILAAVAPALLAQVGRASSIFQQASFLPHLLILLRLEMVVPAALLRLLTVAAVLQPQEALDRVFPAVGLHLTVLQVPTAS